MGFHLGPKAEQAGYRLFGFDSVGSTNAEAQERLRAGDEGKVWFAALQQTAGKGRRGRTWVSPHGNLAASLLLTFETGNTALASLGFVAGVALSTALDKVCCFETDLGTTARADGLALGQGTGKSPHIALKWPNDVLADGVKLAGILLESHVIPTGGQGVVIGIGVNVVEAPAGLDYPTACLAALGINTDAPILFEALSDAWVDVFNVWNNGAGLAEVLNMWRQRATGFGAKVAVNAPGGVIRGVFEDVDDEGRLLVLQDDGTRITITAGDVHFGTTASLRD